MAMDAQLSKFTKQQQLNNLKLYTGNRGIT